MGENKRNIILLAGFQVDENNRGSAALGYGSIPFLLEKGFADETDRFCMMSRVRPCRFWRILRSHKHMLIGNQIYRIQYIKYVKIEYDLYLKYGYTIPFSPLSRLVGRLKLVAATNGGDGFTDIYGAQIFYGRLTESRIAMKGNRPLVIMPQTIGPFKDDKLKKIANDVLLYAHKIYVRDTKYVKELQNIHLKCELEKDLSYYMKPEPWSVDIAANAVGINVSGLAYSNKFRDLSGQFDNYPRLINTLIEHFQRKGVPIYLIPHSYNYYRPERYNDDLLACRNVYNKLSDKSNVTVIDKNLKSPQVKYVISKMSFFIGTRMHANFAAIFTGVPAFGLAYSYKFTGAFEANGLSERQTYMIKNLPEDEINYVVELIGSIWEESQKIQRNS